MCCPSSLSPLCWVSHAEDCSTTFAKASIVHEQHFAVKTSIVLKKISLRLVCNECCQAARHNPDEAPKVYDIIFQLYLISGGVAAYANAQLAPIANFSG